MRASHRATNIRTTLLIPYLYVQGALVRRQAMELNQDVRALINSSTNLPKALSMYLTKEVEPGMAAEVVADDDNGDVDAELCAALAIKGVLGEELQALVEALAELEARAVEQTDAAKKAVLLVQCRMAANVLKVGHGSIHRPCTPIRRYTHRCCVLVNIISNCILHHTFITLFLKLCISVSRM